MFGQCGCSHKSAIFSYDVIFGSLICTDPPMDRFWRPMTVAQQIIRLIREQPGLTERQIAERIFGDGGSIQRVNPTCRKLVAEGWLERHGRGWAADPFTYHAARPNL